MSATSSGVNASVASPTVSSRPRSPGVSSVAEPPNAHRLRSVARRRMPAVTAASVVRRWRCIMFVWGGSGTTSTPSIRRQRRGDRPRVVDVGAPSSAGATGARRAPAAA